MRTVSILSVFVLLFIGGSIWVQHDLIRSGEQLEACMQQISLAAQHEDWPQVDRHIDSLMTRWQKIGRRWNLITEHPEIDDLNSILQRLRGYALAQERAGLLAEAAVAHHLFKHIPQKESFNLMNIL